MHRAQLHAYGAAKDPDCRVLVGVVSWGIHNASPIAWRNAGPDIGCGLATSDSLKALTMVEQPIVGTE